MKELSNMTRSMGMVPITLFMEICMKASTTKTYGMAEESFNT